MNSFNSFESFSEIFEKTPFLDRRLPDYQIYYAHIDPLKAPELLSDHVKTTCSYTLRLITEHGIEPVVHNLIRPFLDGYDDITWQQTGNFIKKLFFNAIVYHDYGKINENFQVKRMNNAHFKVNRKNKIDSRHSILSAYLYIAEHLKELYENSYFTEEIKKKLFLLTFLFANNINRHHASYIDMVVDYPDELIRSLKSYLSVLSMEFEDRFLLNVFQNFQSYRKDYIRCFLSEKCRFPLYALLKLNFSLLTASDYYATFSYKQDVHINDFGILSQAEKECFVNQFQVSKSYNHELFAKKDFFINYPFENLQTCCPENLNILRKKLLAEVLDSIQTHRDKNVFYLEAPTGSGKTNLSLAAALEIFKAFPEINKIFYVFPFTTLITQTAQTIKETLNVTDDQLIELHSKAGFHSKNEERNDGSYGAEYVNYIDYLFVNYPVTLLTHIKFFDILKSNDKDANYLIHRLANSIIIIDEIQSYTPAHWDKIAYFITQYADYFNMKVIIMSATLPKLDLLVLRGLSENYFVPLIDKKENYFQNPNFKNRVQFDFTLLHDKDLSTEMLADFVYEKCENYADTNNGHVKAIIEFIFKKRASEFYYIIKDRAEASGYNVYLLSGTILEPRRKEIIRSIKESQEDKILLISTQVVEAGVDIDMNIGFKDQSLIDSDEQLAGRVNRNSKPHTAIVYIFKLDKAHCIYGSDLRYSLTRDYISLQQYMEILQEKNFDYLYKMVCDKINKDNDDQFLRNINAYREYIKQLEFNKINREFQLIEERTATVFVPLSVSANNFSKSELEFLAACGCYDDFNDIDGILVWQVYKNIISEKKDDFVKKSINLKKIAGIMSQFMFNIHANSNQILELKRHANLEDEIYERFGIIYLNRWDSDKVYTYEGGINDKQFNEPLFL